MAEKIISPGVFTTEVDQSFLPAAIGEIGACVIGPTVKGPAGIPTVVESFADYEAQFGTTFKSGSQYYSYLTTTTARNYLKNTGKLTVVRILADNSLYSPASASVVTEGAAGGSEPVSASIQWMGSAAPTDGQYVQIGGTKFVAQPHVELSLLTNAKEQIFFDSGSGATAKAQITSSLGNLRDAINNSGSLHGLNITASLQADMNLMISSSALGANTIVTVASSSADWRIGPQNGGAGTGLSQLGGGKTGEQSVAFKLFTHGDGEIMNSNGPTTTNNILKSGSKDNLRWEVSTKNNAKGTFTLLIRRGDDSHKRKTVLENWTDLSLDPTSNNYIEKVIGSQYNTIGDAGTASPYVQPYGDYPNKSKYVRVANVVQTPDYLDDNGNLTDDTLSGSLPAVGSGSSHHGAFFGGNDGTKASHPHAFYGDITANTNVQGFNINTSQKGEEAYLDALNLMSNADEYDINLITLPGVSYDLSSKIVNKAIDVCENRGDCFVVVDPLKKGGSITQATTNANDVDSNYAAMYWPWVQVNEPALNRNVWVPPSAVVPGIYAFNDKVAHPWFAPAGLNRGGIDTAIQAERKLTHANRDDLYENAVNPIATFPGQGVTIWGQKTLQKKASALDRVNVRRLLIKVKKFIASSSRFLVFEQNNTATRTRFLNIVNPYLEQVQSNSGLNAFKVVMDDTNNTPDVVDRNQLYGQLFLQPTKTAEFIVLDFTIMPTGATFPE